MEGGKAVLAEIVAKFRAAPGTANFRGLKFHASPNNKIEQKLLTRPQRYDRTNMREVSRYVRVGAVCFDIGANIGVYSVVMSKLSGDAANVHSFEPVDHLREKLLANAKLNGFDTLRVSGMAVGDRPGTAVMYQINKGQFRGGTSSLIENSTVQGLGLDNFTKKEVVVVTVDEYVTTNNVQRIDFMKIDVEGYELKVLQGGREAIGKLRPAILFEFDYPRLEAAGEIIAGFDEFFRSVNYRVMNLPDHSPAVLDDTASRNVLALPN